MPVRVIPLDGSSPKPLTMPDRFRHDVTYFATPAGVGSAPELLGEREYWINPSEAQQFAEDGVITIVSPLDSDSRTELELTEEQEVFVNWLVEHQISHVRLD